MCVRVCVCAYCCLAAVCKYTCACVQTHAYALCKRMQMLVRLRASTSSIFYTTPTLGQNSLGCTPSSLVFVFLIFSVNPSPPLLFFSLFPDMFWVPAEARKY